MGQKRLEHPRAKHDQIVRSWASIIATSCQNCLSRLTDLQERYDVPLEVKSVIEPLVEAMEGEQRLPGRRMRSISILKLLPLYP
jgi:hypothetical protein